MYSTAAQFSHHSLRAAKRVFVAYVERPINSRAPDADLIEARRLLEGKFPGVEFELAYFFHADGDAKEREVAPGVTAVDCSYRRMMNGEIWHEIDYDGISDWLRAHVAVADPRSDAEKAAYAETRRRAKQKRFRGEGNPLKRRINELQYRLYRHLDEALQEKGILPREKALWF